MVIEVLDQDLCNGCGICVNICPEDVLYMAEDMKVAYIKYPEDCVACFACEFYCPLRCIEVGKERAMELPLPY